MSDSAAPPLLVLPLRAQPPLVRKPFAVLLVIVAACAGLALGAPFIPRAGAPLAIGVGAIAAIVAAVAAWRFARRSVQPSAIVLTAHDLALPTTPRSTKVTRVPLGDIRSVERRAPATLLVGTARGFFMLPVAMFADPADVEVLRSAILSAIGALPGGDALVAAFHARAARGVALLRRRPIAAHAMLVLIGAVFLLELALSATSDPAMLLRMGANAPALVHGGQWWRIFTAGVLHLSTAHVLLNASALASFGPLVERLIGTARFLILALLASVAGNLFSAHSTTHTHSVGASSMIFGLLGAHLVINARHGKLLPAGFLLGKARWASLLGINAAISLLPGVDGLAHLGGVLAGGLGALLLVPTLDEPSAPRARAARIGAVLLCALYGAAVVAAALHAFALRDSGARTELYRVVVAQLRADNPKLNDIVWSIASDPASDRDTLRTAALTMREVAATSSAGNVVDTAAYALQRAGEPLGACLALERRAAQLSPSAPAFTMLARLLKEAPTTDVGTTVSSTPDGFLAQVDEAYAGGVVYCETQSARGQGLLRVVLAPNETAARVSRAVVPGAERCVALFTDVAGPEVDAGPSMTWQLYDSATLKLPWGPPPQ